MVDFLKNILNNNIFTPETSAPAQPQPGTEVTPAAPKTYQGKTTISEFMSSAFSSALKKQEGSKKLDSKKLEQDVMSQVKQDTNGCYTLNGSLLVNDDGKPLSYRQIQDKVLEQIEQEQAKSEGSVYVLPQGKYTFSF